MRLCPVAGAACIISSLHPEVCSPRAAAAAAGEGYYPAVGYWPLLDTLPTPHHSTAAAGQHSSTLLLSI